MVCLSAAKQLVDLKLEEDDVENEEGFYYNIHTSNKFCICIYWVMNYIFP